MTPTEMYIKVEDFLRNIRVGFPEMAKQKLYVYADHTATWLGNNWEFLAIGGFASLAAFMTLKYMSKDFDLSLLTENYEFQRRSLFSERRINSSLRADNRELSLVREKLEDLRAEAIASKQESLEALSKRHIADMKVLSDALASAEADYHGMKGIVAKFEDTVAGLEDELSDVRSDLELAEERANDYEYDYDQARCRIVELEAEVYDLESQNESLDEDVYDLRNTLSSTNVELEKALHKTYALSAANDELMKLAA